MLVNKKSKYPGSIPQHQIRPNIEIDELLSFLEENLILFQHRYLNQGVLSEPRLNEKLELLLQHQSRMGDRPFMFKGEKLNDEHPLRKVDIGVMISQKDRYEENAFFSIECKRLPTPGHGREKEYVSGNLGGIERFKRSLHGETSSHNAIVAYVQQNEFEFWHKIINEWIEERISFNADTSISWFKPDKLNNICGYLRPEIAKYISNNFRDLTNDEIKLYHLWVKLS